LTETEVKAWRARSACQAFALLCAEILEVEAQGELHDAVSATYWRIFDALEPMKKTPVSLAEWYLKTSMGLLPILKKLVAWKSGRAFRYQEPRGTQ
jgi:hypothetical protein